MRWPRAGERGSATVLGVGVLLVVVLLTGLLLTIAGTRVAGGRAAAAADLGALAGAGEVLHGRPEAACRAAARVVAANGAVVSACRLVPTRGGATTGSSDVGGVGVDAVGVDPSGVDAVEVIAEVTVEGLPMPGASRWSVRARAVAGPVPADPAGLRP